MFGTAQTDSAICATLLPTGIPVRFVSISRDARCLRRRAMNDSTPKQFELHFESLFGSGRAYAFPCDPEGKVDLDQLSEHARINYLYARAVVGRELAFPAVRASGPHRTIALLLD
jgi:hypothetical protein